MNSEEQQRLMNLTLDAKIEQSEKIIKEAITRFSRADFTSHRDIGGKR